MTTLAAIGSYTAATGGRGRGITIASLEPGTGCMQAVAHTEVASPAFVRWCGDLLFAVSELPDGALHSYRWNGTELVHIDSVPTAGGRPCQLAIYPVLRQVVVADYDGGTFSCFGLSPDGHLVRLTGAGPHPTRQDRPHPHCAVFSPDGSAVALLDIGLDTVSIHDIDAAGVKQEPRQTIRLTPGSGPRHAASIPGGLAVVCEINATMAVLHWDPDGRVHRTVEGVPTTTAGDPDAWPSEIATSSNGDLMVGNRTPGSLSQFTIDHGVPTLRRNLALPPANLRHFALTDTSAYLALQDSDLIVELDLVTGRCLGQLPVGSPSCVAIR